MGMKECITASTNGQVPSSPPFHAAQQISIIQGQRFNRLFFCTGSCARWSSRWCCPQTCPPIYSKSKPSKPVYSSKSGNSVPQTLLWVKRSLNDGPVRDTELRKREGMLARLRPTLWECSNMSHPYSNRIDKPKALSLLLHTADISHPSKPWPLHSRWTKALMEEFFRQVGNLTCDCLRIEDEYICFYFSWALDKRVGNNENLF